jgi:translation elongation factor EF-4
LGADDVQWVMVGGKAVEDGTFGDNIDGLGEVRRFKIDGYELVVFFLFHRNFNINIHSYRKVKLSI